jgi:predicted ester cyclase
MKQSVQSIQENVMDRGDGGRAGTRAVVEAAGECFNAREYEGLDAVVAADMVNNAADPQGREGWKQVWKAIVTCFPDATAGTKAIVVEGDTAAVHMTITGTHEASAMPLLDGLEPAGRHIEWEFVHLFRVQAGLIVEHSAVRDDLGLLRQLTRTV